MTFENPALVFRWYVWRAGYEIMRVQADKPDATGYIQSRKSWLGISYEGHILESQLSPSRFVLGEVLPD